MTQQTSSTTDVTVNKKAAGAPRQRSLRWRIMRVVAPLIIITFLLIGLAAAVYLQQQAQNEIIASQQDRLDNLTLLLNTYIEQVSEDARLLANGRAAREFARDTMLSVSSASIGASQARLLSELSNTLEQEVDQYLAARYVTYTGTVWSEATNNDNTIPVTNDRVQLNAMRDDPLLQAALSVPIGQVVLSDITFPGGLFSAARSVPYLRVMSPVGAENDPSNIIGAIELNVLATPLLDAIRLAAAQTSIEQPERHYIAVTRDGRILLDTANANLNVLQQAVSGGENLASAQPALAQALEESGGEPLVAQAVNGEIVTSRPILVPGDSEPYIQLLILDQVTGAQALFTPQSAVVMLLSLFIGIAITGIIYLVLGRVFQPMQTLAMVAAGGLATAAIPQAGSSHIDEIDQLAQAFAALAKQAEDLRLEMEQQNRRFSRSLDISARIGHETAALRDIDQLLNRAINLISVEYGFYHAQVFLIDDVGKNAILVYSTGEAGQQLLQRKHRIAVGADSVVGIATRTGEAVIINDTQNPGLVPWRFNPLLPDTRSEAALPLQIGTQIIGALDVQSTRTNAFAEHDLSTFQLLADQIAVAIQNARLLQQSQERVEQIDTLNRQLTRLAWEETGFQNISQEYRYDLLNVTSIKQVEPADYSESDSDPGSALELPITVRGEVIGTMAAEGANFTENEQLLLQAVAERVAIAIESARLFEETQNSLAETSTLYQLSRYLNEADNLEGIIQAIVMSVMLDATGGQILVFDRYRAEQPETGIFAADWSLVENSGPKEVSLQGLELNLADHPLLRDMQPNSVVLVSDTARDTRLDEVFRAIVQDAGAGAIVLIPFSVRAVWRGVIMIEFPRPRQFSDREGRLYTALIDQAGVAIDNRMLLRENEMALAQIERLYSASRSINMSASTQDLVTAAGSAAEGGIIMALAALEGEIDTHGWSNRLRLLAVHANGETYEQDAVYDIAVSADSPLKQREPQIVYDRGQEDDTDGFLAIMRAMRQRTLTAFPLYSANQPIALFMLMSEELGDLSAEDYEVYRALTGQMSTVLQNRRLLEQTASALDETRRLYAASRAITAASNTDQVFAAAAANLVTPSAPANRIALLLASPTQTADATHHEYRYLWTRDSSSEIRVGRRIASEEIAFGAILKSQQDAMLVSDVQTDLAGTKALRELLTASGTNSAVLLPVRTRARWFGVLLIESVHRAAFSEAYVRFASAIADQMALALESQLLFNEAQEQAQRALALAEAGQFASRISGEDFAEIITEVFTKVADSAKYTNWELSLVDPTGQRLMFVTQFLHGIGLMPLEQINEQYMDITADNPVPEAFRLNRPLLINDPRRYPSYAKMNDEWFEFIGKRLYMPVRVAGQPIGVIAVGRTLDGLDLDDSDIELASTLAAQIGVAVENRRLFTEAQSERQTLFTILATLPAGVLVLDPVTYKPIQSNQQATQLLGREISPDVPFSAAAFNIYRSGTESMYADEDLPIFVAAQSGEQAVSDDVVIRHEDGSEIALLVNAAPIKDADGTVSAIVAAFEDISALRGLENSLQSTLRETITLYESTRAFAEAEEMDDVLDQSIAQMTAFEVSDVQVVLLDEEYAGARVVRSLSGYTGDFRYPDDLLEAQYPRFIDDIAHEPSLSEEMRALYFGQGIRAAAALPLRSRSRREVPLGWLVILCDSPQRFREREQFLTTLADTAAVALDNRNLFRSTEIALQETASLYAASSAISRARNMEQIASALQGALQSLQADVYAMVLIEKDTVVEVFNEDLDGAAPPFADMISRYNVAGMSSLFVDDLKIQGELSPFERELANTGNIRSFGMMELQTKGQVRGILMVGYHRPHRFSNSDVRFLNAITDSASVVLDNVLLLDEIRDTLQETSILYQASRALSDAQTSQEILDSVVAHLQNRAFTQAFVAILSGSSWDAPGASVTMEASWQESDEFGVDLAGVSLSADQFPAWSLLASPETLIFDDIRAADLDPLTVSGIQSLDLVSVVIMPLRVGGRPIGVIVLGSNQPHQHSERDVRIFRSFAEQASLRIDSIRLLSQTERRARQLATSAQVSQIASSILELDFLLPRLVDVIRDSFAYDHVQIFLMDAEDRFAELRASTGEAGQKLLAINHKLEKGSQSVIGQVTALGQPIVATDTSDARVVHRPNPYLPNTRSEAAIPLILKGQVVGALDVQSNLANAFDEDDVAVLTTLASQIAVAIDNAQLFEQSRQRANEMSFLFTVTTAAAAAESLSAALENVAEELRASLDALSVSIYLPERYVDADERLITLLRPVALAGTDQPLSELSEVQLTDERSLIAETARSARPIIIANTENERDYLPVAAGAQSAVIVPLVSSGEIIGLVTVESQLLNAYNQDTLTLLLTLSGTLSAIVQNQQLLEQVQRTNEQLRELDRLKSDFLANMSHELRTPLNSIIGFSKVILKGIDGPLTEMQEQDLSTIYTSGMHLLNLINDILDQAKIAAGKMDLQVDFFDIKGVIDGVRSIGIGLVKDKPITIQLEVAPSLPKIYGDEFRTRQVLLNLVSNAAKFTHEGTITIRAYPITDAATNQLMVRTDVIDTGIGIAEKDIPMLFEAFRQVDSSLTRTVGGTGLGLPIAKSLVEMQGGQMLVQSKVNAGSTFSIIMPTTPQIGEENSAAPQKKGDTDKLFKPSKLATAEFSAVSGDSISLDSTDPYETGKFNSAARGRETIETGMLNPASLPPVMTLKRQILLIEDNPDMVDQFRRTLQREGYEVYAASIPMEAEAMASGLHPTLIVLSASFGGGMGWDILARLKTRDDTIDIPVIVVALGDDEARAKENGAFAFIRRPFTPEALVKAAQDAERDSRTERILIIDDQPESIRILQDILDEQGRYRVFTAQSGIDGIALVARRRPDLVILDLRMPEMDGFDVIRELRGNPETSRIPILVVTGDSLSPAEQDTLMNYRVIPKTSLTAGQTRMFFDGLKDGLQSEAGN